MRNRAPFHGGWSSGGGAPGLMSSRGSTMKKSTITWIVYDGTGKTRPHSIRKEWMDAGQRQRAKFENVYLLHRAGEKKVENQGFHFKPSFRWDANDNMYFHGWEWEGRWPDYAENQFIHHLQVGDAWAEWPSVGSDEPLN